MPEINFLFDTTYILPFFGIEVHLQELVIDMNMILKLNKYNLHLVSNSLLEAKWLSIRNYKKTRNIKHLEQANEAIESMYDQNKFKIHDPFKSAKQMEIADHIYILGHKDYMDCLILATAIDNEFVFISEDKKMKEIVNTFYTDKIKVHSWKQFIKLYGG